MISNGSFLVKQMQVPSFAWPVLGLLQAVSQDSAAPSHSAVQDPLQANAFQKHL